MEDLSYLSLGQLNEKGDNWEGWKSSGIPELLIKDTEEGKKVYITVSGVRYTLLCPVRSA